MLKPAALKNAEVSARMHPLVQSCHPTETTQKHLDFSGGCKDGIGTGDRSGSFFGPGPDLWTGRFAVRPVDRRPVGLFFAFFLFFYINIFKISALFQSGLKEYIRSL